VDERQLCAHSSRWTYLLKALKTDIPVERVVIQKAGIAALPSSLNISLFALH
jgi:hypothetical protein